MFTLKHPTIDIGIVCSNFEKSLHFYHDLLGLEIALDIQIPEETAIMSSVRFTPFLAA